MKATSYVNSPRIDSATYFTRAQLTEYAAKGFEIAGHTLHHIELGRDRA